MLPLVFAYLALGRLNYLTTQYTAFRGLRNIPGISSLPYGVFFADMTKNALIFALLVFTVITLLWNKPPVILPDKLKHVLVPLVGSCYTVLYALLDYFPHVMRESLVPDGWRHTAAVAGLGLSILGYSIAVWAILYLRRSFALLVSVREVVLQGPYRYVRHPIYTGYLLDAAGLILASPCLGMLLLAAGLALLLICRAQMEEEKLAEADPSYRAHIAHAGFLFPRLIAPSG